ncbi:MAG: flagellar export protein FliJ [Spirochaetales bacterium]|nr:flagellar export protein FliJ [Spirochaetales bacterium]
MKRFNFPLQVLQDLRAREEEKAKLSLGAITSTCNDLDRKLEILAEERFRAASVPQGSEDLGNNLSVRRSYLMRIDQATERVLKDRALAEEERLKAAERYRETHRELEVLVRLRNKRKAEHRKMSLDEEQKIIDDMRVPMSVSREVLGG